jgi:molecular chaperone GrpE
MGNDPASEKDKVEPGEEKAEAAPSVPPAAEAPPAEALTPEQKLARDLAAAQAEGVRVRDQLLRTAADFDNFRKRSRREVDEAQRRGRESAIKDLLPVFDNLERATAHAEGAPDAKSVADGLRIVMKQFVDTLDKMGVKRVASVAQPFDPSVHEAISHVESTEHPAGVIVAEVQPGYAMGDHLLRAALVVVSKGPPEPAQAE